MGRADELTGGIACRVDNDDPSAAVICTEESGAIQFANAATQKVFGYQSVELIRKRLSVVYRRIRPPRQKETPNRSLLFVARVRMRINVDGLLGVRSIFQRICKGHVCERWES
jgi:PAS domain-containing protein